MAGERYQKGFIEGEAEIIATAGEGAEVEVDPGVPRPEKKSRRLNIPPLDMTEMDRQRGIGDRL